MLITISGLYGSGGQELGLALSKALGYPVYDRELMSKAVENSGLDMRRSTFEFYDEDDSAIDEKLSSPYTKALLSLQLDVLPIGMEEREQTSEHRHSGLLSTFMDTMPINHREGSPVRRRDEIDRLKFAQAKVVLDAAENGNGVFLGRCTSYILDGRKDSLRIFTCASLESCRERIAGHFDLQKNGQIDEFIKKTNRRRAYYFETFTGLKWDDVENYDYCINTDCLGLDNTLELIKQMIEMKKSMV